MDGTSDHNQTQNYALNGKIMLTAIVILFSVVIFMVCLHLYARWYLLRARRRQLQHRNRRRTNLVFYVDPSNSAATVTVSSPHGLEASVLKSLPVFNYSPKSYPDLLECAVCLSEFEDGEKGRRLPKCNHSFHIDCIDMWFQSHSTCPLCRSPVEPAGDENLNPVEVTVTVNEPEETEQTGSSSGLGSNCTNDDQEGINRGLRSSSSSFSARRKQLIGVSIEIPRCSGDEIMADSPASHSYKSPVSRMRSLKRMLSRGLSPSGSAGTSSVQVVTVPHTEFDLERGNDESTQHRRGDTPR